jgi:hypothetical protein
LPLDGKGYLLALFAARFLVRGGGAKRGIEGDVAEVFARRARLNVTAALTLCVCA